MEHLCFIKAHGELHYIFYAFRLTSKINFYIDCSLASNPRGDLIKHFQLSSTIVCSSISNKKLAIALPSILIQIALRILAYGENHTFL